MLELKHINKYYNAGTVNEMCLFEDFNLTIKDRQFVSVVGSNGSGKTSTVKYHLRQHSSGRGTHHNRRKGHHQDAGIQAPAPHRTRLSESGHGHLPYP